MASARLDTRFGSISHAVHDGACNGSTNWSYFWFDGILQISQSRRFSTVNPFFQVSPQEKVQWGKIWGPYWPLNIAKSWDELPGKLTAQDVHVEKSTDFELWVSKNLNLSLKNWFLQIHFLKIWNRVYSDRSELDHSDGTIRFQNLKFGRKLWKNCWK